MGPQQDPGGCGAVQDREADPGDGAGALCVWLPIRPSLTGRVVDSPIWLPRGPIAVIVHRPLGGGLVASFAITGSSVCNSHVGRISTSRCYSDEGMKTERLK